MKYLLMIYANPETWAGLGPDDWSAAIAEQDAFNAEFFRACRTTRRSRLPCAASAG